MVEDSNAKIHLVVKGEQKKFDTKDDVKQAFTKAMGGDESLSLANVEKITLGGNSYGYEACEWLSDLLKGQDTPSLTAIDFSNIFVSRLRAELPKSLELMSVALLPKQLVELDLSDNAFGPDGIRAFECLLINDKQLRVLKITNCGLGPEGGEMIAEALSKNEGLKLTHFHAGRDRLEDKGITALASVFKAMGSLEEIHVPQNGIKDEGMS
jgi:Ran GTPase-activating protein 1